MKEERLVERAARLDPMLAERLAAIAVEARGRRGRPEPRPLRRDRARARPGDARAARGQAISRGALDRGIHIATRFNYVFVAPPLCIEEGDSLVGAGHRRLAAFGASACVLIGTTALAAGKDTEKPIEPGPSSITAEEAAIQADPSGGAQHGVILVEEALRDERGGKFVFSYHLRAKILSGEGRKLADLEIPIGKKRSALKSWWGRTILPDGRVLELPESALTEQTVVKWAKGRSGVLKGALQGVEPGAVIDYGFVVQASGYVPVDFVQLEREWPVRNLRYVLAAGPTAPTRSFASSHLEGRKAEVKSGDGKFVVTASDLTRSRTSRTRPPSGSSRRPSSSTYGYPPRPGRVLGTRGHAARSRSHRLLEAAGDPAHGRRYGPSRGDPSVRLQAAYDWVETHFANTDAFSAERAGDERDGRRGRGPNEARRRDTARNVLATRVCLRRDREGDRSGCGPRLRRRSNRALVERQPDHARSVRLPVRGGPSRGKPDASWTIVQPASGMQYGELPWRATGSTALLCTPEGMKNATLPPVLGPKNKSETRVKLVVADDEAIRATWSRTALGASGYEPRRDLRRLDPAERKSRLETLCARRRRRSLECQPTRSRRAAVAVPRRV
jgi:hypothetical protein